MIGGCGGYWETVVELAVDLPAERAPIVFFRGDEPPAGWRAAAPANPIPESRAWQVADERLARSTEIGVSKTEMWPTPIGWLVSIRKELVGTPASVRTNLLVTASGTREVRNEWQSHEQLYVARDLIGHSEIELVLFGEDDPGVGGVGVVRTVDGRRMTGMLVASNCE